MNKLVHYSTATLRALGNGTLHRTLRMFFHYRRIERAVIARYGLEIQAGPFVGMKYVRTIPNHALIPKLIGIYEMELHPCVEAIVRRGYDRIVNVGSAEGCYAVGLARRMPATRVHAFDTEAREQQLCRELARVNGVADRVAVGGHCDEATLHEILGGRTLAIVDIEGAELELLDPTRTPRLAGADILVEVHDFDGTTRVSDALKTRFAATHEMEVIPSVARRAGDHPMVAFLPSEEDRRLAVLERESPQEWLFLRSRALAA